MKIVDRLRDMIEFVTDLKFSDDDGLVAKGKDIHDEDIEPSVGYHFGFYSRPKDGARGIVVKVGGRGNTSVLVAFRDKQYEMTLEKGECGMKNAFDASILLNKDGEILLNGGSAKVGRVGDAVDLGNWTHVPASGAGVTPCKLLWKGPGSPGLPAEITTAQDLDGEISEGAEKVKA